MDKEKKDALKDIAKIVKNAKELRGVFVDNGYDVLIDEIEGEKKDLIRSQICDYLEG